jgi:hypothetical protein
MPSTRRALPATLATLVAMEAAFWVNVEPEVRPFFKTKILLHPLSSYNPFGVGSTKLLRKEMRWDLEDARGRSAA